MTVTDRQYALLLGGKEQDPPELFDINKDPRQENNIYSENKAIAENMAKRLFEFAAEKGISKDTINAYRSRLS